MRSWIGWANSPNWASPSVLCRRRGCAISRATWTSRAGWSRRSSPGLVEERCSALDRRPDRELADLDLPGLIDDELDRPGDRVRLDPGCPHSGADFGADPRVGDGID